MMKCFTYPTKNKIQKCKRFFLFIMEPKMHVLVCSTICMKIQIKINECSKEGPENRYVKYNDHELHLGLYGTMPLQKSHVNCQVTTLRQTEEFSFYFTSSTTFTRFPGQINIKIPYIHIYPSIHTNHHQQHEIYVRNCEIEETINE